MLFLIVFINQDNITFTKVLILLIKQENMHFTPTYPQASHGSNTPLLISDCVLETDTFGLKYYSCIF